MNILNVIQSNISTARVTKNKRMLEILTTLKGEIERHQTPDKKKIEQDEHVIPIIRSYLKSLTDGVGDILQQSYRDRANDEINIIKNFLPRELTYDALLSIIAAENFGSIKECMQFVTVYQKENDVLINRADAKNIYETLN